MKLLIVATLLVVALASPPQPRGTEHATETAQQVQQQTDSQKHKSKPLATKPILPASPNPSDPKGGDETPANKEQPVRIVAPIPITMEPDHAAWIFNISLIVVGFLQVWLLLGTLKATRDNAEAAKDNAAAARLNAEVLMEGSAAHLTLAPLEAIELRGGVVPQIVLGVLNKGATPAFDCIASTWIEVLPFPFSDFTEKATFGRFHESATIDPNSETPTAFPVKLNRPLTERECREIVGPQNLILAIRLNLEYEDAFERKRYRNFGFFPFGKNIHFLPKYNDSGKRDD
jgi:hypothetical protein